MATTGLATYRHASGGTDQATSANIVARLAGRDRKLNGQ
jgi:hypothetical protein